ncbi:MAG: 16S rRNA (cytosine(1402)-N(4))-methyltransferase RsmH [bacterium]|nr:16S rRNA (cytosine(1402)-N(4))-methyltransferase RsmH [bacterium]
MSPQHYPVMHREVIDIFKETHRQWFIDCTLGMGGHTRHLLKTFTEARAIGLDVDGKSLDLARENLDEFKERVQLHRLNFISLFEELDLTGKEISGLLVDPGLSIYQLKDAERGFSHTLEARLDMRKDLRSELTAYDVVNNYTEKQLTGLFEAYGEIRRAAGLAKKIIEARLFGTVDTTVKLTAIVEKFYGWRPKRGKTHPAANIFQALRIAVNRELEEIDEFIKKAPAFLKKGARIVFLSFHSVEDRIVKKAFIALQKEGKIAVIKPFPAFPSESEVAENLPSRSVKLRAGEVL